MSRSRKSSPASTICGRSNKKDKRIANRRFRRLERQLMSILDLDRLPVRIRDVSNVWSFSGDGLACWMNCPLPDHPNPYWTFEAWKKILRK